MRIFGWFRKDPNAPLPPDPIVVHHWLRARRDADFSKAPNWVHRVVRGKPTHVDERFNSVTFAYSEPAVGAPFGLVWKFEALTPAKAREYFEVVTKEESDYLEERISAWYDERARIETAAFMTFAGVHDRKAYLERFPRTKKDHVDSVENVFIAPAPTEAS